ncbi:MAG TPA: rhodanese-like domain-containing protein [Acidimicrobiales bacterium]|nr:rhodanese-like domain-containing protein [Acidimicrobiales bacterium]
MSTDIAPEELRARLDGGERVFVLDVRELEEVAEWAFPGAHHIPLGDLGERTGELPLDAPIVVVCHAGVRSAVAAEALTRAGWPAANLAGGVEAWLRSGG